MLRSFIKMEGCGNDYIYFDCLKTPLLEPDRLSILLSDRHFGIGGDGIVLICTSDQADAKMRMFNNDGSEGKMCGNAIRCVAKYLYEHELVPKEQMAIETLSGIRYVKIKEENHVVVDVCVDMAKPILEAEHIPVSLEKLEQRKKDLRCKLGQVIHEEVYIGDQTYTINCISMGNPHCVVFVEDLVNLELEKIGPSFENAPMFPEKVNTEFVKVIDRQTLEMRVWERGSGETLACGTGACASVVAAVLNGYCNKNEEVTVRLRGGELKILYTDETIYMTGNAHKIFEGVIDL